MAIEVEQLCVLLDASCKASTEVIYYLSEKLPRYEKQSYFRGSRFSN